MAYSHIGDSGMNENNDYLDSWQFRGVIFSIVLAAIAYLGFSMWAGWKDVVSAFKLVGICGFLILLGLSLVNYILRFGRWQIYLSALKHKIATKPSAMIYFAGFALTTTPGKAGELLRGVFLTKRGVPYTNSTAAFISERLSDLFAITILAALGVHIHKYGQFVIVAAVALAICLLLLVFSNCLTQLQARLATRSTRITRFISHFLTLLNNARICHTPAIFFSATILSLIAWTAEAYAFYLALQWMDFNPSIAFAFSVYALSMLAGALSFLPGGLGGTEVVMAALLIWAGMPETQAIAATVIIRLATLWFAVALGATVLMLGQRTLRDKTTHINLNK